MGSYEPGQLTIAQARDIFRAQSQTRVAAASEDQMGKYNEEAQEQVDDIVNRSQNAKTDTRRLKFGNEAETPAPIADGEQVEPTPNLNSPPKPSIPSTGGPGDFDSTPPTSPNLDDYSPTTPSSPTTPGNDFDLPNNSELDDNPWEDAGGIDPDDVSGGLASGGGLGGGGLGGGGLGGGGLGGGGLPGGGAGGGAGGGLGGGGLGGAMGGAMGGGMMGGAGGGRGAGAGAGGGRGAGGAKGMGKGMGAGGGRGAMAGGMMGGAGGGRGMGGAGEGEQETGTWLTEEDDVWGIGNEEEDPYA